MSAWPFEPLRPFSYGAIIADPPWAYEMRSELGYGKSPETHYTTMDADAIEALPVGELAGRDCLLWLWSTWPHLPQALETMRSWGFTYKTGGSWTKTTRTGKRAFGTGYIFRTATEPFLIGTIGEPAYRSKSIRNLIESERREHSRKPPEARQMIERLLPDVFAVELFAREPWPGQTVWGNESGKFGLAQDAKLDCSGGGGVAEGGTLGFGPAGLLSGDAIVDGEGGDGQLGLFGQQSLPNLGERVAIDVEPAELRRDRQPADRLDDDVAVGGGSRDSEEQGQDRNENAHGRHPSRVEG